MKSNSWRKKLIKRFPADFMFQLNPYEFKVLMSQFVISKKAKRGRTQKLPYAFTEHGITMLLGILRSDTAIKVNIGIVRASIMLKQYTKDFKLLQKRIDEMESKIAHS